MLARLGVKRAIAAGAFALTATLGAGLPVTAAHAETLRYATIGEPPSLDTQMGTAVVATMIGQHMFETLYALDSATVPQPLLATGETVSDDGKIITISLREGVPFHNGKEMKAEDVAASIARWAEFGARGSTLGLDKVEATGDYEVTVTLKEPNGAWKSLMSQVNGGPVIYPSEIVAEAGGEPIKPESYIGTGPYKFSDWRPNRYVELVKFDDYAALDTPSDGYAGKREAVLDTLRFIPVSDVGTRVSGVQAGDYDYAEFISGDLYGILKDDPSVTPVISDSPIFGLMFMNSKDGIMKDNWALRRAVLAALNMTEALQVSVGDPELWQAQGAFFQDGSVWHTDAGLDAYNAGDPEKAKALAEEAGYDGTPIRLLVSTNYQQHFDQANVFKRQLADAGIEVELDVRDWATLLKQRAEPGAWDMFMTHHNTVADPALLTFMNDNYPGWWTSDEKEALEAEFINTSDADGRPATWEKLQTLAYEQVPAVKVGDVFSFDVAAPGVTPAWEKAPGFHYWWGASK
ncbi:ABC transporter substrate-binding protein [Acuticoccus sp. I52.16.1]|uniref:ABC transporter substrate-binding protein n=1 Tax=Acuticoccus sp. I52.16.1 TaxID=2928472 RepID=UPI001FD3EAE5|nr:ABC transporter substrate-binding protein [Acuticoccus sp. I52.16.1]UOM35749.1 ABC transporter substrate-binding protein [Acuticoccus sp. I52.16.1]